MFNKKRFDYKQRQNKFIINHNIRYDKVVCIDHENNNLGIIQTSKAINIAGENGLDLVLVSPPSGDSPPTVKILDFGKYRYEQEKKEKLTKKKQRENAVKIKEIKLRPSTDDNDLQIKANQMKEFVSEGNKLKVSVIFRGRELSHRDIGIETLKKFINMIECQPEDGFAVNGKVVSVMLTKKIK